MANNHNLTGEGGLLPPRLDTKLENIQTEFQGGPGRISYRLDGTTMQVVTIQIQQGETIYAESGGMSWMTDNVEMTTNTGGGISRMFKRAVSGESLFVVDFTVRHGTGIVAFSNEFPGKIIPIHLNEGESFILQKDAFLAAEKTVELDLHFKKKLGAGLFGGEGFILQRISGPGIAFAEIDGEVVEYTLEAGQVLKVDTGHVAAFEPSVKFDITMVKGVKNILFGGEGLFLAQLQGPGRVWLQTMPLTKLAEKIFQYLPRTDGGGGGSSGGININLDSLFGN